MIRTVVAGICFAVGIVFFITEAVGLFKFRYCLDRIHIIGLGDTLGLPFIAIGLIVLNGFSFASLKLIIIGLFLMLTGPALTHLIGQLEVMNNKLNDDNSHYTEEERHGCF